MEQRKQTDKYKDGAENRETNNRKAQKQMRTFLIILPLV